MGTRRATGSGGPRVLTAVVLAAAATGTHTRGAVGGAKGAHKRMICAEAPHTDDVAATRPESAFGALYTNDNKAELTIMVTLVICRPMHKHARMQHPLFGRSVRPYRPASRERSRGTFWLPR
jgi:hypothetical protein